MFSARTLPRIHRESLVRLYVCVWFLISVVGLWWMFQYASTSGARSAALSDWPRGSLIQRAADAPTLIMFVHPRCPCTRASLAELERVVARSGGAIHPRIVFSLPVGASEDWRQTELRAIAERIPGAVLIDDVDGLEARRFGAQISGITLLYDINGKLTFQGGITAGRGHQGDNAGESSVVRLLRGAAAECSEAPAYGCPIQTSANTVGID